MTLTDILKKRWYVFVVIIGVIVLLLVWSGYFSFIGGESFSSLSLYESNESLIPQGYTIALTEEDFKEFPQLASIIRDKNTKPTVIYKNGIRFYHISFTSDEYSRFISHYWSNWSRSEDRRIFEYKGEYYEYGYPAIH